MLAPLRLRATGARLIFDGMKKYDALLHSYSLSLETCKPETGAQYYDSLQCSGSVLGKEMIDRKADVPPLFKTRRASAIPR